MARNYSRDSKGRFASGGGSGGAKKSAGSAKKPASAAKPAGKPVAKKPATAKSAAKPAATKKPAAKPAAKKPAAKKPAAKKPATQKPAATKKPAAPTGPANAIKPSKGLGALAKRQPVNARSKVVPTGKLKRPDGAKARLQKTKAMVRKRDRSTTRDMLHGNNMNREVARQSGGASVARTTVQRRQQRAFEVANGRNPKLGSKALYVYQGQLSQLGKPANQRLGFSRKPMTARQAASAAAVRQAANVKRISDAMKADTKAIVAQAMKASPKGRKRKPKP